MQVRGAVAQALGEFRIEDLIGLGLRDANAPTLLFGSHARGDARLGSDVDVLQLAHTGRSYMVGSLSVTTYRQRDLLAMALRGSLFLLHLRTDGRILRDVGGELEHALAAWQSPPSYQRLHQAVRAVSGALAIDEDEFSANAIGFMGLATFLARTELYARCVTAGQPEFSIIRAAHRCGVSRIGRMLDDRRCGAPSWKRFVGLRRAIRVALGIPCENQHGSLEALVVHLDEVTPVGATVVLRMVLGASDISYHLLPPDEVPW